MGERGTVTRRLIEPAFRPDAPAPWWLTATDFDGSRHAAENLPLFIAITSSEEVLGNARGSEIARKAISTGRVKPGPGHGILRPRPGRLIYGPGDVDCPIINLPARVALWQKLLRWHAEPDFLFVRER